MDRPDEKPDLPEEVEIHKTDEPGKPGPSTQSGGTPPPPPPPPPDDDGNQGGNQGGG